MLSNTPRARLSQTSIVCTRRYLLPTGRDHLVQMMLPEGCANDVDSLKEVLEDLCAFKFLCIGVGPKLESSSRNNNWQSKKSEIHHLRWDPKQIGSQVVYASKRVIHPRPKKTNSKNMVGAFEYECFCGYVHFRRTTLCSK